MSEIYCGQFHNCQVQQTTWILKLRLYTLYSLATIQQSISTAKVEKINESILNAKNVPAMQATCNTQTNCAIKVIIS